MKVCPKCGKQYESGNFCEDCENENGSPVKLEEESVKCPTCGRQYKKGTKFCSECGVKLSGMAAPVSVDGVYIGDKNVIAGDVIGKKEVYQVEGNATIIHNEDETKKVFICSSCGKHITNTEVFTCKKCGQHFCKDCFDPFEKLCKKCRTVNSEYKAQTKTVNPLVQKLSEKLANYCDEDGFTIEQDIDAHARIVKSTVIPNNKKDFMDFLDFYYSQMNGYETSVGDRGVFDLYYTQAKALLKKSKLFSYEDDKEYADFMNFYDKTITELNRVHLIAMKKRKMTWSQYLGDYDFSSIANEHIDNSSDDEEDFDDYENTNPYKEAFDIMKDTYKNMADAYKDVLKDAFGGLGSIFKKRK